MGRKWWIVAGLVVAAFFWNKADARQAREPFATEPPSQTQQQTAAVQLLELPAVVRGSELILQQTARYEGPFLEDAIQEPVSDAMAVLIYNPGSQWVSRLLLELRQGDRVLLFEIEMLPPGSRVLVLERSGQLYSREPLHSCRCLLLETADAVGSGGIAVEERGGALAVTNRTGVHTENVTLLYKQYHREEGFYLGGRVDRFTLGVLLPGQSREVVPDRYVSGSCRVLTAETE